jgi:hypothetical protein
MFVSAYIQPRWRNERRCIISFISNRGGQLSASVGMVNMTVNGICVVILFCMIIMRT